MRTLINKSSNNSKDQEDTTIMLYSFDIFDTLVTRRVAEPVGIFSLVKQNVQSLNIPERLKENFDIIRLGSEEYAHSNSGYLNKAWEVTFDDIYEIIKDNFSLSDETTKALQKIEIETEIKNLVPLEKNLTKLKKLVDEGEKVILISDMYYSAKELKYILSHIDKVFENLEIYVSSEFKTSKSEGNLYEIISEKLNVAYKNWTHFGDNTHADIAVAQKYGIKTNYFKNEGLLNYENFLLWRDRHNSMIQLYIGAARLCRIKYSQNHTKKDVYNFGASFAAPILFGYADYIVDTAILNGFKTLYFIARDGYIPKLIVDEIIKEKNLPIKTKYLYGSRLAWRIPSASNVDDYIQALFEEYGDRRNIEFLSYRLGIDPQVLASILNIKSIKKHISDEKAKQIVKDLKHDDNFKKNFLSVINEKRELLKRYFKQEIDFSEKSIAFVDLQGTGRTQDYIADILNEIAPCCIYTIYFNTDNRKKSKYNSIKKSYYIGTRYMHWWLELLGRTTDSQTKGFKQVNQCIEPILYNNVFKEKMIQWGFNDYIQGIIDFTKTFIKTLEINKNITINNSLNIYFAFADYLYSNLDRTTADVMGSIPWSSIGNESNKVAAPKYSRRKALKNLILSKRINTDFPFIVIARSEGLAQKLNSWNEFIIWKYGSLRKFFINVEVHSRQKRAFIRIFGIKISFARLLFFGRKHNGK